MARRATVSELTDEEAAAALIGPSGVIAPGDAGADGETPEYTGAEIALLEQNEGWATVVDGDIDLTDDSAFEDVQGRVTRFLSTSKGRPMKVIVTDEASSNDLVNLYDTETGQPYMVARASLQTYLAKTRPNGKRVFAPRPTVKMPPRNHVCPAKHCLPDGRKKPFATPDQAQRHFEYRHREEAMLAERNNQRRIDEEALANGRHLTALLGMLVAGQGNLTEDKLKEVTAALQGTDLAANIPNPNWERARIIGWMDIKGITFRPEFAGMNNTALCRAIGVLEPEAAVA